ncbi:hypothetical protein [Lactococcus fujiensis]|uniref:hypothetical protein n=1 Tax=Lactococcus fujiensis TaxID=610251 RepID=UPI0020931CE0|nr:hypothetical protein [Lactococcus fujiensis]
MRNEARLYFTHRANTSEINAKAQAYFDGEHPEHYFHADKLISLKERRYQMNPSNYLPLFDNFEAWKSAGNMGTTYLNWSNEQKNSLDRCQK